MQCTVWNNEKFTLFGKNISNKIVRLICYEAFCWNSVKMISWRDRIILRVILTKDFWINEVLLIYSHLKTFRETILLYNHIKTKSRWFHGIFLAWSRFILLFLAVTHCGNFGISLPRFFRKNSVKSTFY